MIKSLTNLENKKGPNYVKQKIFLFLFSLLLLLLFCCWKTGVYTRVFRHVLVAKKLHYFTTIVKFFISFLFSCSTLFCLL